MTDPWKVDVRMQERPEGLPLSQIARSGSGICGPGWPLSGTAASRILPDDETTDSLGIGTKRANETTDPTRGAYEHFDSGCSTLRSGAADRLGSPAGIGLQIVRRRPIHQQLERSATACRDRQLVGRS